ncbi:hypothetical protein [Bacillus infantis]|uniref:hypothetical protein n=1 Tax=Bacillus infantis TaxID=324767 RepID=UPI003CEC6F58
MSNGKNILDENGYIIPHCNLCRKVLNLGEKVIMDSMYYITHSDCQSLNPFPMLDQGEFSEVVGRNFRYFPSFVERFNETGVYKKKAPLE